MKAQVLEDVYAQPHWTARMERVLAGCTRLSQLLRAAEKARTQMTDVTTRPCPHETGREIHRQFIAEIRRHDGDVPIQVSTEPRKM